MAKIDEAIFKAYDVRGIYQSQIDEKTAYDIGRGYARFILKDNPRAENIVVGSDMKLRQKRGANPFSSGSGVDQWACSTRPILKIAALPF